MSLRIGGIACHLTAGLEFAAILTRSEIPVHLHRGLASALNAWTTTTTVEHAVAEIVVLDAFDAVAPSCPLDAVRRATLTLATLGAQRVVWMVPGAEAARRAQQTRLVVETMLEVWHDAMAAKADEKPPAHTALALHYPVVAPPVPSSLLDQAELTTTLLSATAREGSALELRQHLDELARQGVRHLICPPLESARLTTVMRGADTVPILAGAPPLAVHLSALLRLRGWLGNRDRRTPRGMSRGSVIVHDLQNPIDIAESRDSAEQPAKRYLTVGHGATLDLCRRLDLRHLSIECEVLPGICRSSAWAGKQRVELTVLADSQRPLTEVVLNRLNVM